MLVTTDDISWQRFIPFGLHDVGDDVVDVGLLSVLNQLGGPTQGTARSNEGWCGWEMTASPDSVCKDVRRRRGRRLTRNGRRGVLP